MFTSNASKLGIVWSAVRSFFAINTFQRIRVLKNAESVNQGLMVYDITLEKHNAYYANGILVENCADSAVVLCEVALKHGLAPTKRVSQRDRSEHSKLNHAANEVWEVSGGVDDKVPVDDAA